MMAPESERAMVECPVHGSLSVQRRVKIQAEGEPLACTCEVDGEEVEVGRGAPEEKSSTSGESPSAIPPYVEMEWTPEESENFSKLTSHPPAPPTERLIRAMKPTEPALTCSEVVERLATEVDEMFIVASWRAQPCRECRAGELCHWCKKLELFREKATAILHSWRERRVQELEEKVKLLEQALDDAVGDIANGEKDNPLRSKEVLKAMYLKDAERALTKSAEWREQIRKGAKHE